jgi:hypothetical protein
MMKMDIIHNFLGLDLWRVEQYYNKKILVIDFLRWDSRRWVR